MERRHAVYPPLHAVRERLVQILDRVVLHVLAPVAAEAVDAVDVANRLEGVDDKHDSLLLDVYDALVGAPRRLAAPGAEPDHVLHRVVRRVPIVGAALALVNRLGGGRAGVYEEGGGNLALHLVAAPVELVRRARASLHVHYRLDQVVYVYLLAVFELADAPEHLRHHHLELAADPRHQAAVAVQRSAEEVGVALGHRLLAHLAPARLVVVRAEVPLVVNERLRLVGLQRIPLLVNVDERAVAEVRVVGQLKAGLLEQVVGEHSLRLLDVAFDRLEVQLRGVLEKLLELLLRYRLAFAVLSALLHT